jgi:hypothetical protein
MERTAIQEYKITEHIEPGPDAVDFNQDYSVSNNSKQLHRVNSTICAPGLVCLVCITFVNISKI